MNQIDKKELTKKYISDGYCVGPTLFEDSQIIYLRKSLEDTFSKKGFPRDISLFDINDPEAVRIILSAVDSEWIKSIFIKISDYFNTSISPLPIFDIQRNYHVDRIKSPGMGWHRDCNGEMQYDYCREKLFDKSYVFGKIGIYLQENLEYGGSVDLIPFSHKDIKAKNFIINKLTDIPLKLLIRLHSNFPNMYKQISEQVYMNILKAKKLSIEKGSVVLFDSRIYHRGSPIADSVRNEVVFNSNLHHADVPPSKNKYSIYCHFGSTLAYDSYMYDRLKRKGNSLELQRCVEEQKKIENHYPKFASSIQNIMDPVLIKYKDYLHKLK
ncbi:hypothetical protein N9K55_03635 [Candidatus Pelagibacter bacterium]|nr:hypothetical protein [Candidatus Pelagibacter bacterium]